MSRPRGRRADERARFLVVSGAAEPGGYIERD